MRAHKKCAACGKRIRDHQPDLVLRSLSDGDRPEESKHFHTGCGDAAFAAVAAKPAVYTLTIRHVEGALN